VLQSKKCNSVDFLQLIPSERTKNQGAMADKWSEP